MGRHLILVAGWAEGDPDDLTGDIGVALDGLLETGSGAVVALGEDVVDARLRAMLRMVQLEEAANA